MRRKAAEAAGSIEESTGTVDAEEASPSRSSQSWVLLLCYFPSKLLAEIKIPIISSARVLAVVNRTRCPIRLRRQTILIGLSPIETPSIGDIRVGFDEHEGRRYRLSGVGLRDALGVGWNRSNALIGQFCRTIV